MFMYEVARNDPHVSLEGMLALGKCVKYGLEVLRNSGMVRKRLRQSKDRMG